MTALHELIGGRQLGVTLALFGIGRAREERKMPRTTPPALVESALLVWARKSIGLDVAGAAKHSRVKPEQLREWEAGQGTPSIAQLRSLAKAYKRPLAVFFLPAPPMGWDAMRDFRRLPEAAGATWSPSLHGEYRRANEQREDALELFDLLGEVPPEAWRVSAADDDELADAARGRLMECAAIMPPTSGGAHVRLGFWTSALEEAGVLVLTSSGVEVDEMRGFSIHADPLPVIMVNGKDGPNGRTFSLLHEYSHLLIGAGGLCDQRVPEHPANPDRELEARCNRIAASILMPVPDVLSHPLVVAKPFDYDGWTDEEIRELATRFGVSGEAVLRRLVTLGRVPMPFYAMKRAQWQKLYGDRPRKARGGGNYYRNHARNLGKGFVRLVVDAHAANLIDSLRASRYLDAKVTAIKGLAEAQGPGKVVHAV